MAIEGKIIIVAVIVGIEERVKIVGNRIVIGRAEGIERECDLITRSNTVQTGALNLEKISV